jgi:glycosyltransferase involved in cell wall biosynthesis
MLNSIQDTQDTVTYNKVLVVYTSYPLRGEWFWTTETAYKVLHVDKVVSIYDETYKVDNEPYGTVIYSVYKPVIFLKDIPLDTIVNQDSRYTSITLTRTPSNPTESSYDVLSIMSVDIKNTSPLYMDTNNYITELQDIDDSQLKRVDVITPCVSIKYLEECMRSVKKQTYIGVLHWIVIDGEEYYNKYYVEFNKLRQEMEHTYSCRFHILPENTGMVQGKVIHYGHRVLNTMAHQLSGYYISILDDDNTIEPTHISSLVCATQSVSESIGAFSFRNIMDIHGTYITRDEYESLGCIMKPTGYYLCDTSTYLFNREKVIPYLHTMYGPIGDRRLTVSMFVNNVFRLVPTGVSTLNYRNHKIPINFFTDNKYLDTTKPMLWVFHFNKYSTQEALRVAYGYTSPSILSEFHPYMLSGLVSKFQLLDGYSTSNLQHIPLGSSVLIHLCNPSTLPISMLQQRTDLKVYTFTIESPNIRHQEQWNENFLKSFTSHVITYEPSLFTSLPTTECHNYKRVFKDTLQLEKILHQTKYIQWNEKYNGMIMVLENRSLSGIYSINGKTLECWDHKRKELVERLVSIHENNYHIVVVGAGWNTTSETPNKYTVLCSHSTRFNDKVHAVEYYTHYKYVLIIENCSASNYVSEKVIDAWIAGSVPIYMGGSMRDDVEESMVIRITDINTLTWKYILDQGEHVFNNIMINRFNVLSKYTSIKYCDVIYNMINE